MSRTPISDRYFTVMIITFVFTLASVGFWRRYAPSLTDAGHGSPLVELIALAIYLSWMMQIILVLWITDRFYTKELKALPFLVSSLHDEYTKLVSWVKS